MGNPVDAPSGHLRRVGNTARSHRLGRVRGGGCSARGRVRARRHASRGPAGRTFARDRRGARVRGGAPFPRIRRVLSARGVADHRRDLVFSPGACALGRPLRMAGAGSERELPGAILALRKRGNRGDLSTGISAPFVASGSPCARRSWWARCSRRSSWWRPGRSRASSRAKQGWTPAPGTWSRSRRRVSPSSARRFATTPPTRWRTGRARSRLRWGTIAALRARAGTELPWFFFPRGARARLRRGEPLRLGARARGRLGVARVRRAGAEARVRRVRAWRGPRSVAPRRRAELRDRASQLGSRAERVLRRERRPPRLLPVRLRLRDRLPH